MKFRQKIRSKTISLPVNSDYVIRPYFNSLSGLIETNVQQVKISDAEHGGKGRAGIMITKKEVLQYKEIVSVRRKMGSLDIECAGNVHKVYSIPKDIYNEVMAFLTNRISEVQETQ